MNLRYTNEYLWKLVLEIDDCLSSDRLTSWEVDFIGSLIDRKVTHFSEKQADIILRIHAKI